MIPDYINGSYELLGGLFIALSIVKLHKDKAVMGVHWLQVLFYASWGFWNLYYYSHLEQVASLIGGIGVVVANTVWLGQIIYYQDVAGSATEGVLNERN